MSSFFDEASLVMIPSGYKDQKVYSVKPLDGSGDLTFSRASSATRVASNGLIEKVRTNLILQSEAFNTSWSVVTMSVTANTTANPLNGALTADTITLGAGTIQKYIEQGIVLSGNFTASVYLKAGTQQFVQILLGTDPAPSANFDLVNGTASATNSTASIVSVGGGFFRCSMSFTSTIGTNVIMLGVDSLAAARFAPTASTGTFIAFGAQVETGDVATDYIATTTTAVSVGPVSGLPRLDYLNSSCPRLLLEPQRSNLLTFSEQMNNAAYGKGDGIAIEANATTSPDGYTSADKIYTNTTVGGDHFFNRTPFTSISSSTAYTFSIFAKKAEFKYISVESTIENNNYKSVTVDLSNGNISNNNYAQTPKVEDYGNGWYRISVFGTSGAAQTSTDTYIIVLNNSQQRFYTGNGVDGIYTWGWQLETGAYATSYIPTLGASVTRVADTYQKAGFGNTSTAGTLYYELDNYQPSNPANAMYIVQLFAGSSVGDAFFSDANSISLLNQNENLEGVNNGYATTLFSFAPTAGATVKIALRYDGTNVVAFVNGVKGTVFADTSVGVKNAIRVNNGESGTQATKQLLFFPTALSDTQCIELTA
jgi:hypothetical protein